MHFLPLRIASFTTSPPPVTTSMRMPRCCISSAELSSVGLAIEQISVRGPPAARIARLSTRTARLLTPLAAGCGWKTTALPAATADSALLITVSVGLVVGVIEPMTPHGAGSTSVRPSSPV